MLGHLRKRIRPLSTLLVLALTGLWLANAAAQCVSTPACDTPGMQCANGQPGNAGPVHADETAAPCSTPAPDALIGAAQGFTFATALISAVFTLTLDSVAHHPPPSWHGDRPPHTPIYLQHLALLL